MPRKPRYQKPEWAVGQVTRLSGLVEDTCKHGVGHPNSKWLADHPKLGHLSIHGCDGCCLQRGPCLPTRKKSGRRRTT
jgi:hypothetical protein